MTDKQKRVDEIEGELDGTTGSLEAAQKALEGAQTAESTALTGLGELLKSTSLRAIQDVAAFAALRDNQPVLISRPSFNRAETDFTKRVYLFGFPDRRTLYVRGRREDIKRIRKMVTQFDRPAPQAMITLWTIELSSKATKSGHKKAMRALALIDQGVASGRDNMAEVLRLLYREVGITAAANAKETTGPADCNYNPALWMFYRSELLECLLIKEKDDREKYRFLTRYLPRPTGISTLAEAITVLALADAANASKVLRAVRLKLKKMQKKGAFASGGLSKSENTKIGRGSIEDPVPADSLSSLDKALGQGDGHYVSGLSQSLMDVLVLKVRIRVRQDA